MQNLVEMFWLFLVPKTPTKSLKYAKQRKSKYAKKIH